VKGLIAAGRTFENSPAIRKACDFLLSKELPSGGWGESYLSAQHQVKFTPVNFFKITALNSIMDILAMLLAAICGCS